MGEGSAAGSFSASVGELAALAGVGRKVWLLGGCQTGRKLELDSEKGGNPWGPGNPCVLNI